MSRSHRSRRRTRRATNFLVSDGSDYILAIEIDGVRIVHLGDCGQVKLTASQLRAIGRADVVIGQLANQYSAADPTHRKGLDLARSLTPRLFIPSAHVDVPSLRLLAQTWSTTWLSGRSFTVTAAVLPDHPIALVMGMMARTWGKVLQIPADAYPPA